MTTKGEVLDLHRAHPDWTSGAIAEHLGCDAAYVRSTFYRNGISIPRKGTDVRRLAERERCAAIAERMGALHIAEAIRAHSRRAV